jgi:hypothetical protein
MAIRDGDAERARALLEPLLERKKLHFSEFDQLCAAMIDLNLAEDKRETAESWLKMWESADPENPQLMPYRARLGRFGRVLDRLFRR